MAHDEARADRIRALKAERPDLTWRRIADAVGVGERSALYWQRTGGIGFETAKKLAQVFEVDPDWLYSGRDTDTSPDLMGALNSQPAAGSLEELVERVEALHAKVDVLLDAVGARQPGGALAAQMQRMSEQVEEALSHPPPRDAEPVSPAGRSRRTRPEPATRG